MTHSSYSAIPAANPCQSFKTWKRLALEFELWVLAHEQQIQQCLVLSGLVLSVSGMATLFAAAGAEQLVSYLFLGTFFCYGLGRTIALQNVHRLGFFLAVVVLGSIYVELSAFWFVQAEFSILALAIFGRAFALHYAFLCSARLPEGREKTRTTRRREFSREINRYTFLAIGLPNAALWIALFAGTHGVALISMLVAVLVGSLAFFYQCRSPLGTLAGLGEAIRNYYNENRLMQYRPGIFLSPAGSFRMRLLMLFGATLICSVSVGRLGSGATAIAIAKQEGIITEIPEGNYYRFGKEGVTAPDELLADLFLVVASLGHFIYVLPAALASTAALFISSPILAHAYSTRREAEESPTLWYDTVETMLWSDDEGERHSLLWGVVAADNSPILVPVTALSSPCHILGAAGSGKTTMALGPLVEQLILGCIDRKELGDTK